MINYLQYSEIDKNKWNACIENAVNGNIYAFSWYLDSACECWDALVEDDYSSVMPLTYRKKIGFYYIYPPSLVQQLGVFSVSEVSTIKVAEFIQAIPTKFKYALINLNHQNHCEKLNYTQKSHINLELDLNKPYAELRSAYSENLRRNLKKIPENLFSIHKSEKIDDLIELFKSEKANKIDTLPRDFYPVLQKIFTIAKKQTTYDLWQVYTGDELNAGVLFVTGCKKAVFLFSGSSGKAKENNAMHFLIDSFIKKYAGSQLVLDFEGSDNGSLARFYRSFGAVEKNYSTIEFSKLPSFIIFFLKSFFKIKKQLL